MSFRKMVFFVLLVLTELYSCSPHASIGVDRFSRGGLLGIQHHAAADTKIWKIGQIMAPVEVEIFVTSPNGTNDNKGMVITVDCCVDWNESSACNKSDESHYCIFYH